MGALSAVAQEHVTIDGIKYFLNNSGTASISTQSESLNGDIIIPDIVNYDEKEYKVTTLATKAFSSTNITSIELPEGITSLSSGCFQDCLNLSSVTLHGDVTTIQSECFSNCDKLISLDFLPNTVTSLGDHCFEYCDGLTSINLPDNLTTLGEYCFARCENITDVTIPNGITIIPRGCFYLSGIQEVSLPETIKKLQFYSFGSCKNLKSITLPKSIISLDASFFMCSNLAEVICQWENLDDLSINEMTFTSIFPEAVLRVPKGTIETYKANLVLRQFKNIEEIGDDEGGTTTGLTFTPEQRGVMVTNDGQTVTVSGLEDGERVELYAVDGTLLDTGAAVAAGTVSLNAGQATGVVIVKAGQSSMKVSLR